MPASSTALELIMPLPASTETVPPETSMQPDEVDLEPTTELLSVMSNDAHWLPTIKAPAAACAVESMTLLLLMISALPAVMYTAPADPTAIDLTIDEL
mmetsp:Transcript_64843/g.177817  ORF Transcript_64843/g.177817 Transcript_64843/m.177817 type:complete len:98 (+) Transcript_64843:5763-6056(+)